MGFTPRRKARGPIKRRPSRKAARIAHKLKEVTDRNSYIITTFLEGRGFDTAKKKPKSASSDSKSVNKLHITHHVQRSRSKVRSAKKLEDLIVDFQDLELGTHNSGGRAVDDTAPHPTQGPIPQPSAVRQRATAMVEDALKRARGDVDFQDTLEYAAETEWNDTDEDASEDEEDA